MTQSPQSAVGATSVMVVDDDPAIVRMLELLLRKEGLDVVALTRAFGVMNTLAEKKPEILLLDVMMPGLDGPALTGLIRNDPDLARTRIYLYSALDEPALARRAAECGADGYLSKARSPLDVSREVARLARQGR